MRPPVTVCCALRSRMQEKRLQLYDFEATLVREWLMDAVIRYIKVSGGPPGKEGLLLGLKSGAVLKIFVDTAFPIPLVKHPSGIRWAVQEGGGRIGRHSRPAFSAGGELLHSFFGTACSHLLENCDVPLRQVDSHYCARRQHVSTQVPHPKQMCRVLVRAGAWTSAAAGASWH